MTEYQMGWYDAVKEMKGKLAAELKPRWISVEERLPKRYEHVLVATRFTDEGEQDVDIAYCALEDRWRKPEGMLFGSVTHWMPLPEPPVKEEHQE